MKSGRINCDWINESRKLGTTVKFVYVMYHRHYSSPQCCPSRPLFDKPFYFSRFEDKACNLVNILSFTLACSHAIKLETIEIEFDFPTFPRKTQKHSNLTRKIDELDSMLIVPIRIAGRSNHGTEKLAIFRALFLPNQFRQVAGVPRLVLLRVTGQGHLWNKMLWKVGVFRLVQTTKHTFWYRILEKTIFKKRKTLQMFVSGAEYPVSTESHK